MPASQDTPEPDTNEAQDLIDAVLAQRNAALDQCVRLAAQLAAAQREIATLRALLPQPEENP